MGTHNITFCHKLSSEYSLSSGALWCPAESSAAALSWSTLLQKQNPPGSAGQGLNLRISPIILIFNGNFCKAVWNWICNLVSSNKGKLKYAAEFVDNSLPLTQCFLLHRCAIQFCFSLLIDHYVKVPDTVEYFMITFPLQYALLPLFYRIASANRFW